MKKIEILLGDACNLNVKSNSVDLILTSPPYSGVDPYRYGGDYSKQININNKKMLKLLIKSTKEMSRVLKKDGSIIINIGHNDNMPYLYISEILRKTNLKIVNPPFITNYLDEHFQQVTETFNASYGFWFHLSKGPEHIYHNPFTFKRYHKPIWDLQWNDKNDKFKEIREIGFVEDSFNPEIAKRFIEIFTKPNAIVLDPFGGSGVTAIEAYKAGRKGISIDISSEQTELAKIRFKIETGEDYEK